MDQGSPGRQPACTTVVLGVVIITVLIIIIWFSASGLAHLVPAADRGSSSWYSVQAEIRGWLLAALGGAGAVAGIWLNAQSIRLAADQVAGVREQLKLGRAGLHSERLKTAVEQLSSPDEGIRRAAVYAFRRVGIETDVKHEVDEVVRLLSGFIRDRCPRMDPESTTVIVKTADEATVERPAEDVQAALDVLSEVVRRRMHYGQFSVEGSYIPFAKLAEHAVFGSVWRNVDLSFTDATEADFSDCDLDRAQMVRLSAREASFERATLRFVVATGAWFSGANFRRAILTQADLSDARFDRADLTGASFRECSMVSAAMIEAVATGVSFGYADLTSCRLLNADLRRADFTSAKLVHANLSGSDLRFADLRGADLSGARYSQESKLHGALVSRGTTISYRGVQCIRGDKALEGNACLWFPDEKPEGEPLER